MEREVFVYNGVDEVPEDVVHVRVDPSITVIRDNAFDGHFHLEEVELPEGLLKIGDTAFGECRNLKRINIPSTVKEIDKEAFFECGQLEGIILPKGLEQLGKGAFQWCISLQRINIPSGINVIREKSLCNCEGLTEIIFSEGICVIEEDGCSRCKSLVSLTLPSSIQDIGVESFEGCDQLNKIYLPNSILSIEGGAFKGCNITTFRVPPLMKIFDLGILGDNTSLVTLELSEHVTEIWDFTESGGANPAVLNALRNIALPPECEMSEIELHNCTEFRRAFLDDDDTTIRDALKQRFDGLPIHEICYYHSYHDKESTLQNLRQCMDSTGKQQDCLGMTPLHILACSTKQNVDKYRLLIEKYPETLIVKDKWGDLPLLYALWCNAPTEVLDFLVESYKSLHPDYEIDWGGMILTLAERNAPLVNIEKLITTQQQSFPDQKYGMQALVIELASSNAADASSHKPYTSIETFRCLLQVSISKRLDTLGIARWRIDLENYIDGVSKKAGHRDRETRAVYDRLTTYESIKEGTSVLELALWKAAIDERHNKRAKVEGDDSYKVQWRINCGADIVIKNVLPYLLPKLEDR